MKISLYIQVQKVIEILGGRMYQAIEVLNNMDISSYLDLSLNLRVPSSQRISRRHNFGQFCVILSINWSIWIFASTFEQQSSAVPMTSILQNFSMCVSFKACWKSQWKILSRWEFQREYSFFSGADTCTEIDSMEFRKIVSCDKTHFQVQLKLTCNKKANYKLMQTTKSNQRKRNNLLYVFKLWDHICPEIFQ